MPPRAVFVAVAVAVLLLSSSCPTPARARSTVIYVPPVDAPVIDPFRPPSTPYGPGNRGLEYATSAGSAVAAAADGVVAFAGTVAGARHVTVSHEDGLRTSYSFLAEIEVVRGQRIRSGDPVGTATNRFHFGVRDAEGNYLDPESLFSGELLAEARLIPGVEEGASPLAGTERSALLRLVLDHGMGWIRDRAESARLAMHYAVELRPDVRMARLAQTLTRLRARRRVCTPADEPAGRPAERRIAVLVGGLGSTSTEAAIDEVDTATLGFSGSDVVRFSYAGGLVPDSSDDTRFDSVPTTSYGAAETTGDLETAAERFVMLLQSVAAVQPGVPIDVIAHSQGGVVARLAVAQAASDRRLPAQVSTVVTIATPHNGADLATAATALGQPVGPIPDSVLESIAGHDPSATSIGQLSEVSDLVDRLDDHALPESVRRVSIAARGDVVVPVPRTLEDELPSAVIALTGLDAHDRLPGAPATTREIALAIAGQPPSCVTETAMAMDAIWGEAASFATDTLAAAGLAHSLGMAVGP